MSSTGLLSRRVRLTYNAVSFYVENIHYYYEGQCFVSCTDSDSSGLMHVEDRGLNRGLI